MKYLIAGLGNVGPQYENTRHNIGFMVVDRMAEAYGGRFAIDKQAFRAQISHKGRQLVLIKPTTLMNLSGKAVNYWLSAEKIPLERLLVITDDLALPFGKIRLKGKGSDGGHNGLKDIMQTLNSPKWARLRFGIGSNYRPGQQVDHVLSPFSQPEQQTLPEAIDRAAEASLAFATLGLERAMNQYN